MRDHLRAVALLGTPMQLFQGNEITAGCVRASICRRKIPKIHPRRQDLIILIIILLVLMFASFPAFPYSRGWGYYPSGGLGTILLIVIILWLLHVI
jgi:hypothetical protein